MNYISNFVTPNPNLPNGQLDEDDKEIINNTAKTIDDCMYFVSMVYQLH